MTIEVPPKATTEVVHRLRPTPWSKPGSGPTLAGMDNVFEAAAAHRGGYILRQDLLDLGVTDADIRGARRAGVIVRLRAGTYAPQGHERLSREEQYRLLCFAVQDKSHRDVVLSHYSASIVQTGTSYGLDLSQVHVTEPTQSTGRVEAGIVHHGGRLPDEDVVEVDGHLMVVPARAALETASLAGVEAGMVQVCAVLRSGVDPAEFTERLEQMARWPGIAKVRLSVLWSTPECESVGEVRSVYMFRMGRLPIPRMQVEFFDANGRLIARVDFDWEDFHHCGEFDGLAKYGRLNPYSAENLGQVLADEKVREDRVRAIPRGMSRWIYPDLNRPQETCRRIYAAMQQSLRLYGRPQRTVIA